jgi:hypothetical protein
MSASPSDPPAHILALRVALGFAAALTVAEGWDLEFSFVAALVGRHWRWGPSISALALIVLPPLGLVMATVSVLLVEALAVGLLPVFLLATVGCLWLGFKLSARNDRMNIIGLMILVRLLRGSLAPSGLSRSHRQVVHDLVWNVLVGCDGGLCLGLVLPGPATCRGSRPRARSCRP